MKLKELIQHIHPAQVKGNDEIDIEGVAIDSREVGINYLFCAVKGTQADGHKFIESAIEKGAKAILCEVIPEQLHSDVTYIMVDNTELNVGQVATDYYGNPSHKLKLVGVTGTNGKTTIATLLYEVFRAMGHKCGLCSTVCNYIDGKAIPTSHTTPDPITLNKLLGQMADEGCEYVFMEVSSHSVVQQRIGGLTFAGGIFTNLTRDHMDFHKTVENYRNAKKKFFDDLPKNAFAITNADDKNGMIMVQNTKAKVYTYSQRTMADFKAKILEESFEGMNLDVNGTEVCVNFVGHFNVSNLLAIYGAAVCLGKDAHDVLVTLSAQHPVNGRFETLHSPKGYTAIVDYAHTPDALENVLSTINEVLNGKGRVITVCGAGGNRDKGKRPLMAQAAANMSDQVVITSDNPRFEEPEEIINDMLAGLDKQQMTKVLAITDRKQGIRTACRLAQKGDVILVAGKGHEDYQEIKGVKHPFDDHKVLREIFEEEQN